MGTQSVFQKCPGFSGRDGQLGKSWHFGMMWTQVGWARGTVKENEPTLWCGVDVGSMEEEKGGQECSERSLLPRTLQFLPATHTICCTLLFHWTRWSFWVSAWRASSVLVPAWSPIACMQHCFVSLFPSSYLGCFKTWTIINNMATNSPVQMAFHRCANLFVGKVQTGLLGLSMHTLGIGNSDRDD